MKNTINKLHFRIAYIWIRNANTRLFLRCPVLKSIWSPKLTINDQCYYTWMRSVSIIILSR